MPLELYLAYVLVCAVATVTPGPTNMLIVANGMRHGLRAGLLNVAGTEAGLAIMIACVGIGLTSLIEAAGHWFEWVKLAGASYLVWIGWKMFCSGGEPGEANRAAPRNGFFVQGLMVSLGNPKQLVFFGALLPQFVDPGGNATTQILLMGATAIAISIASDGAYALAAGRLLGRFAPARMRLVSRIGGGCLIGGGFWLALSKAR
ncbi:MAG: LysE family translocator [Rhizobiaceae bacterium]|nr:LysE family translocator [Rhizobiaceae bacterium]MCV0405009.1 LysE family translocator [Rhizobiaceae bacterium]